VVAATLSEIASVFGLTALLDEIPSTWKINWSARPFVDPTHAGNPVHTIRMDTF
jgi:hypothetical protein